MRFIGIWYNLDREVARDYVEASNANEASAKLHQLYENERDEPAPCLAVMPQDGYSHAADTYDSQVRGGNY